MEKHLGDLKGKRVLVTGGSGFLGSRIVEAFKRHGADVLTPRSREYNLIKYDDAVRCMKELHPEIVVHSAAYYGGIMINKMHPGKIYFENLVMGANVFEAARLAGVKKLVAIGTACAYPGDAIGELREEEIWNGAAHESVENYGPVKKMMLLQGRAYKREYDFDSIHLILTNLYGPGDTFHPDRSHVVSALIRKFVEAKQANAPTVTVWGTGAPIREFLFVDDCAEAIVRATLNYHDPFIALNIGTGIGTSIKELAETIQSVSGYEGELVWDTSKPDGAMKKMLDVSRMKKELNWYPPHALREGLAKTIQWYEEHKDEADRRA